MEKKKEKKERREENGGPGEGQPVKKRKRRKGRSEDKGGAARDPQKPKPHRTPFDTIIKAGLEPYYPDLIQWLFGKRPRKVSPIDPNLPVIRHRGADKILKISFKDRPAFLAHIEFQMKSDPSMPVRMAEYLILIHRLRERLKCKKTRYFCAVIYFDRKNFHRDPGRLVLEGESTTRLECAYDVIKLWEMDPTAALEMKAPGLWAFAPFMAGTVITNCTCPQQAFRLGGNHTSVPPSTRATVPDLEVLVPRRRGNHIPEGDAVGDLRSPS